MLLCCQSAAMLSFIYAKCSHAERRKQAHYSECRYAECRCAERRGASYKATSCSG